MRLPTRTRRSSVTTFATTTISIVQDDGVRRWHEWYSLRLKMEGVNPNMLITPRIKMEGVNSRVVDDPGEAVR